MRKLAFVFICVILAIFVNTALSLPGSGTQEDPWRIESLADFNEFAADPNYWDDYTRLETDVNLAGQAYSTAVIAPDTNNSNWYFDGPAFTGVFDGNGHKIKGLTIDDGGAGNWYLGLFGFIDGGEVRNLGLEGGDISGDRWVGGLVGENEYGTILNCYSTGDVSGARWVGGLMGDNDYGSISNCYSTGDVSGDDYVGGLVGGIWYGSVSNCYSTGDVSGDGGVGGLVGLNSYGSVSNCYSTVDVKGGDSVGGLVGNSGGSISNCYSTGDVSGTGDYVGGLVGGNGGSVSNCNSKGDVSGTGYCVGGLVGGNGGSVSNCYSTGSVSGGLWVGGLVGRNTSSVSNCFWDTDTQSHGVTESIGYNEGTVTNVEGLPTIEMQDIDTYLNADWDFIGESANGTSETWQMPAGGGYPVLGFFGGDIPVPLAGSGTAADPYLVGTAEELGMVSWYPGDCCFKVTGDIDLSGINWSVPVVPVFNGCFDGDGHKLANMQISGGDFLGLFGYLVKGGRVRTLGLEGGSVSGIGDYVGGLVGYNYHGSVSNCYSTGDISGDRYVGGLVGHNGGIVSNCDSTGDVSGTGYHVGGLVGLNDEYGRVSNCYSTGDVSGDRWVGGLVGVNEGSVSNCYSTGDIDGNRFVGGLAAGNAGSISNCYSTGFVSGDRWVGGLVGDNWRSVSNCYSTGDVSGDGRVGGLVGHNSAGSISNCYSTGDVSGDDRVGGLVGDNWRSILYCYSTGDVSGDDRVGGLVGYNSYSVWNCYSIGDVNGTGQYVGGLVGHNYRYGYVSNCFWDTDTQTHGVSESIGYNDGTVTNVEGLPTVEMQDANTFIDAGWDFVGETANGTDDIWLICQGHDYPRLWWQYGPPVLEAEPQETIWTSNVIIWSAVSDANAYWVECAEDANFEYLVDTTGWISQTSYEFFGLETGVTYWYRVKAGYYCNIESLWSNVESSTQVQLADAVLPLLEPNDLKNENMLLSLANKLDAVQGMMDKGQYKAAISKLGNDILQKTDGCAETGAPDKNDWITTCERQELIYPIIIEVIELLSDG